VKSYVCAAAVFAVGLQVVGALPCGWPCSGRRKGVRVWGESRLKLVARPVSAGGCAGAFLPLRLGRTDCCWPYRVTGGRVMVFVVGGVRERYSRPVAALGVHGPIGIMSFHGVCGLWLPHAVTRQAVAGIRGLRQLLGLCGCVGAGAGGPT